jgi:hypothetical protein
VEVVVEVGVVVDVVVMTLLLHLRDYILHHHLRR